MPIDVPGVDDGPLHFQPEWCRVTLASIGDAVIATDVAGQVTFLNAVAEKLTGWTLAEAAGLPLEAVFHIINLESRQRVESPTVRAVRDGVVVELANHTMLVPRSGLERPIDDSAAPIRNAQGEVAGGVLVFRDITARFHQEQVLAAAAEYAANVIATLREPFVVLDKELRIKTANRAFYHTFHAVKDETEGRFLFEIGDGLWNVPTLRKMLEAVLTAGGPVRDFEHDLPTQMTRGFPIDVEHDFPRLGGRVMLLNACRFTYGGESPDLVLLAIEDVTARKRAEAALKASEARYRRLFQTAKDGILILDAKTGKVIDANPYMTELLGYRFEEFLGKELWEIGLFSDKAASQAAYRELHEYGYVRYDHLPLQTKTGLQAEVEFVCNTYQEEGRNVAQCNIRDISERSRWEKKAREQAAAFADLHRRKDEFLAMLSHELRNPLAPIANAVQLLNLLPDDAPVQLQARTIIGRQVALLTRLVDDLMEVSRITTGRVQLRLERMAVNYVVERAVETVRPLVERHKHDLTISLSPEPVWLYADPTRLEQVVVNLLTNAAKYTVDGGRITLSVEQEGDECVLRVRDTGVGIAPELLPRIFDLFTQAERSLDRSQGGLGIGLALVQRLVELHRGRVEAISVVGRGSEFIVHLPVVLSPAPLRAASPPQATSAPAGPSLRVLVVDDNLDAAESLAMLLQAAGHLVQNAHDGPAAVTAAAAFDPQVVLLDIGLPELDGYQVAVRIRRQAGPIRPMLVAMTGYGQEADLVRSQQAGFDHHLVKPVDFARVREILAGVAGKLR